MDSLPGHGSHGDDGLPCSELGDTTLGAYVHTPYLALEELFRTEHVGPSSVVVDLGCGDGRACLLAAERFGALGVGVDIDASLIRDKFLPKAAAKGLSHRVCGIVADVCQSPDVIFRDLAFHAPPPLSQATLEPAAAAAVGPVVTASSSSGYDGEGTGARVGGGGGAVSTPFAWTNVTHVYLFILQHRLPLLIPTLNEMRTRIPGLVILSAFSMPPSNVPNRTFVDSSGKFVFRAYTNMLMVD